MTRCRRHTCSLMPLAGRTSRSSSNSSRRHDHRPRRRHLPMEPATRLHRMTSVGGAGESDLHLEAQVRDGHASWSTSGAMCLLLRLRCPRGRCPSCPARRRALSLLLRQGRHQCDRPRLRQRACVQLQGLGGSAHSTLSPRCQKTMERTLVGRLRRTRFDALTFTYMRMRPCFSHVEPPSKRGGHRGGSNPNRGFSGLQRSSLRAVSTPPLQKPKRLKLSILYSEQEGMNRHDLGISGLISRR